MQIKIHFIAGINGDRVVVTGIDKDTQWEKEYSYGYNASYNRSNAEYAQTDYEDSLKYGWNSCWHCPKPYIGDILTDLLAQYNMTKDDAEYSGYYVFPQRAATEEEIKDIIKRLYAEVE